MRLLVIAFCFAFISCGPDKEYIEVPANPQNPPIGGGSDGSRPSYAETQALLESYCGSCHGNAQFMGSESALRSSAVAARVRSNNMPPRNATRRLPDAERKRILSFF